MRINIGKPLNLLRKFVLENFLKSWKKSDDDIGRCRHIARKGNCFARYMFAVMYALILCMNPNNYKPMVIIK